MKLVLEFDDKSSLELSYARHILLVHQMLNDTDKDFLATSGELEWLLEMFEDYIGGLVGRVVKDAADIGRVAKLIYNHSSHSQIVDENYRRIKDRWDKFVWSLGLPNRFSYILLHSYYHVDNWSIVVDMEYYPEWFTKEIFKSGGGRIAAIRNIGDKTISVTKEAILKLYKDDETMLRIIENREEM